MKELEHAFRLATLNRKSVPPYIRNNSKVSISLQFVSHPKANPTPRPTQLIEMYDVMIEIPITHADLLYLSCIFRSRIYFGDYVRDRCREDMNSPYYSIPQSQSTTHHHHHQQQSVATSTADVELNNANNNNNNNNNSLVISPPSSLQLHPSSQTSLPSSSTASATSNQQTIAPSVLYTVQRVVSTSQLQQLPSNYGNTSNASSLTSIIARNETDCGLPNNNGESFVLRLSFVFRSKLLTIIINVIIRGYKNRQVPSRVCCAVAFSK